MLLDPGRLPAQRAVTERLQDRLEVGGDTPQGRGVVGTARCIACLHVERKLLQADLPEGLVELRIAFEVAGDGGSDVVGRLV